jgi:hypothetical protein
VGGAVGASAAGDGDRHRAGVVDSPWMVIEFP